MRKIFLLILPLAFYMSNVEAKPGVCGLQYQLANLGDSAIQINLAAYMIVEDTDKDNCRKILAILKESQEGDNNFEKMIKDIATEAKFDSNIKINLKEMRMQWMQSCDFATHGFNDGTITNVCNNLEPQKLYLLGVHGKPTITKLVLDKKLDKDAAFEELKRLLN